MLQKFHFTRIEEPKRVHPKLFLMASSKQAIRTNQVSALRSMETLILGHGRAFFEEYNI